MSKRTWSSILAAILLLSSLLPFSGNVSYADDSHYFPETGHTVKGLFLTYWNSHGGLAQQGYPISDEMQERSDTDGRIYTMQYFERAVFEYHPENQAPFNVLLSLLGVFFYNEKYGGNAPNQFTTPDNPRVFSETGKVLAGPFRRYWETHGGLAQQGYPISNEFKEVSATDGKEYTVQYFQRAVFEYHPEFAGTSNEVLLSLLGVFYYNKKHGTTTQPTAAPVGSATTVTAPTAAATATATTVAGATATPTPPPQAPISQIVFLKHDGSGQSAFVDGAGRIFYQQTFHLPPNNYIAVESLGGGYLFAYDPSGRGVLGQVAEDGSYHSFVPTMKLDSGWTNVTSFYNILAFYDYRVSGNNHVGHFGTVTVNVPINGGFNKVGTNDFVQGYNIMVATQNGLMLWYRTDLLNPPLLGKIDDKGHLLGTIGLYNTLEAGWTHVTRIQNDYLFFYNSANGNCFYGKINDNANLAKLSFTKRPIFRIGENWTNFATTNNGYVITYNTNNGALFVDKPDFQNNRYTIWNYYVPGAEIATGWNFVLGTR